jgi:hypothetical protein
MAASWFTGAGSKRRSGDPVEEEDDDEGTDDGKGGGGDHGSLLFRFGLFGPGPAAVLDLCLSQHPGQIVDRSRK